MLRHQFMPAAEGDADLRIAFQYGNASARLPRMQIDDVVLVSEIHRQYVRYALLVSHAHITEITCVDDRFYLLDIVCDGCLHLDNAV